MIKYNCVMVRLTNPIIKRIHELVITKLGKYIQIDALQDYHPNCMVDPDPHITLIYDLDPIGLVYLTKYLKVNCRRILHQMNENRLIPFNKMICNTFDNEQQRVLKLDFSEVPGINLIRDLSKKLTELPNSWQFSDPYQPHMTLTYLKPEVPEELVQEVIQEIAKMDSVFMIDSILVSSPDGDQQVIRL